MKQSYPIQSWPEHILRNNDLELCLVPDIGGRLIDVRYKGISLLFKNPDLLTRLPDLAQLNELPSRAKHLAFPLWGGEKTWIAPDVDWPDGAPHAVLDSGKYSLKQHGHNVVTLTSDICPRSNLQICRHIVLHNSSQWTIRHQVINKGSIPKRVGLWSVMMTKIPANYLFQLSIGKTPTTVFGNPGNAFSCNGDIGQITCDSRREFKVGIHPIAEITAARISTTKGAVWIINKGVVAEQAENYAHGHALEFYNSGHYDYAELEWHSPMVILSPEKSYEFELGYQIIEEENYSTTEMFNLIKQKSGSTE